ncbi:MAG TPA: TIGR01777 family oxidoreductase [Longimicrobiaceae bacterium]|nr:TIGR01777 family oxidoreductase [Longimicrobiaceae bacterium]
MEQQLAPRLRVAITGSSGLIGTALCRRLEAEGHAVLRLVRRPPRGEGEARWDPDAGEVDAAALEGCDAVVGLAGENVGARWTGERKRRIRASRVDATRLLAGTLAGLVRPPGVFVSASAVGFYGSRGDERLDEMSTPGDDFLARVVRDWEAAAAPAAAAGIRVVHPRLGVVLAARGGALARMLPPFRLGLGGRMGSGRQWMSWIALDDVVDVLLRALRDGSLSGPVNAVAGAVTNAEFTATLGRVLHRPAIARVPAFALRAVFGEMADGTLLASQRVEHRRLTQVSHSFRHPELEAALRAALAPAG